MSDLKAQAIAAARAGDMETARKLKAQFLQEQNGGRALSARELAIDAARAGNMEEARQYKAMALQEETARAQSGPKGSALDPLIEGATFGFRDELAGSVGVLDGLASGMSWKEAQEQYAKWKAHSAARGQQYAQTNPTTSTALEVAGGALTGGAGLVRSGARTMGARALAGAGVGAVSAVGRSEDPTLGEVALGAGGGAAMGALLPVAGRALGAGVSRVAGRLRGGDVAAASQAGAQALEQNAARQLGLFGTQGLREGKAAIRATLKEMKPLEREAFQKGMLAKAEEMLSSGQKLNPTQMQGLKSTLRTALGGGRNARRVLRGVDRLARDGNKSTNKAVIASRVAEAGLKLAGRVSPTARALGNAAGMVGDRLGQSAGLAMPPTPAPRLPPEMLNALMGFGSPQAALPLGGGQ